MNSEEFAKKRKELNLTQEEIAKLLGVSRRTIQNYEGGGIIPDSKSEFLRNFFSNNIGGNSINIGNNQGNIVGGNNIQISLPEEGSQKIVKPDGTIIIESLSSKGKDNQSMDESREKELLSKIDMQDRIIKSYEETIKAQQQTIDLLQKKG